MPSNSPIRKTRDATGNGCLYIVATPIGNKDDITLRALKILETVDWIAAEDTRHTGRFLAAHQIKGRLISCHEYNENKRIPELIAKLRSGASIALVSNAGTPMISDPGFKLVGAAINNGIQIVPIPGVSAGVTALSAAGLATDRFFFTGFLSKKDGKRRRQLKNLAKQNGTIVIYESPRRILDLLNTAVGVMGNRTGVLARELTKRHEEFIRGRLTEITADLAARPAIKGELTLLIKGADDDETISMAAVRSEIRARLAKGDMGISDIARRVAARTGLSKNEIYKETLSIRDHRNLKPFQKRKEKTWKD